MIRWRPVVDTLIPQPPRHGNDRVAAAAGVVVVSFKAPVPEGVVCHYCDQPATTRDHVVAKTLGGADAWWNLVPACVECNVRKDAAEPECECVFCGRAVWLFEWGLRRAGSLGGAAHV